MTFDVRVIINTITLGVITWGFGIEENKIGNDLLAGH